MSATDNPAVRNLVTRQLADRDRPRGYVLKTGRAVPKSTNLAAENPAVAIARIMREDDERLWEAARQRERDRLPFPVYDETHDITPEMIDEVKSMAGPGQVLHSTPRTPSPIDDLLRSFVDACPPDSHHRTLTANAKSVISAAIRPVFASITPASKI